MGTSDGVNWSETAAGNKYCQGLLIPNTYDRNITFGINVFFHFFFEFQRN